MGLSNDILSQFAKLASDTKAAKTETMVYGTASVSGEGDSKVVYVKMDGSDRLTPVATTADVKDGERVTVTVKDHTAIITGNASNPSASSKDVDSLNTVTAYKVQANELEAVNAAFENLNATSASFKELAAVQAQIETINSMYANLEHIKSGDIEAINAEIERLEVMFADITDLSVTDAEIVNAFIQDLKVCNGNFTHLSAEWIRAYKADIEDLNAKKLSAEQADHKYANIDFANIGEAAMEHLYAQSGLIKDVVVNNGSITGHLAGVTITGDLIEGNTIKADKLLMRGDDGLYYKLNFEGGAITGDALGEVTYYNVVVENAGDPDSIRYLRGEIIDQAVPFGDPVEGAFTETYGDQVYRAESGGTFCEVYSYPDWADSQLHGSVIVANSITAEKINVSDLTAFGATIGGFHLTDTSIYSEVKNSEGNTTRGIYMDTDGQFNFGDSNNFVKFQQESENGPYKLSISADSIELSARDGDKPTNVGEAFTEIDKRLTFDDTGLTITCGEHAMKLYLTNDMIGFYKGDINKDNLEENRFGWWDGVDFHTGNIVIDVEEKAQFGKLAFVHRPDGSLSFLKVGD